MLPSHLFSYQYDKNMVESVVGVVKTTSRVPATKSSGVEARQAVYVIVSHASSFYLWGESHRQRWQ